MSDPQDVSGGVRRVGRKDRKKRLDPRKPLFPPEDDLPAADAPPPLEWAGETTPDSEATAAPEAAPEPQPQPPRPRPEPAADRFPPVNPKAAPEPKAAPAPRRRGGGIANVLTALFLLATVGVIAYTAFIAFNPYSPLNPLPPFTPVPIIVTATPLPPTITPIPPTSTPEPTATWTPLPSVATPAVFAFALADAPAYRESAEGCAWSGIAGVVVDSAGNGLDGYQARVQLADAGDEMPDVLTAISGDDGTFVLRLSDTPALTPYLVTLYDLNGQALSDAYTVVTSDRCDQNEVVVRFTRR